MPVFKIVPVNTEDPDWQCSNYCGEVVIREETEKKARALAARTFGLFDPIGQGSCLCPWQSEAHTRCELQSPGDGEPEILSPSISAAHRHHWA
jgi:hypothetical protein